MKKETENQENNSHPANVAASAVERLVRKITTTGFKQTYKDEDWVVLTNGVLRVGVFGEDAPNTNWKNKVLAEHEANFDKWSKHFYSATMPSEDYEIDLVISDLCNIQSDLNQKSGNCYGNLFRSF